MNTEQEREAFEAFASKHGLCTTEEGDLYRSQVMGWMWKAWQARAAMQSQPSHAGWKEALKAWKVCASIHREWANGKDAVFTTRQADFVRHAENAFKKAMDTGALQSQDREDASCLWHNDPETDNSWSTGCRQLFEIYDGTPTENGMGFCCYCGKPIREAIDHARRAEGET